MGKDTPRKPVVLPAPRPAARPAASATNGGARSRILLIDDSTLAQAGLRHILSGHPDIELVGCAHDDAEALDACADPTLNVVIISSLCRSIDVLHLIRRMALLHRGGADRVLLLAHDIDDPVCADAETVGVGGVVRTSEPSTFLLAAVRVVARGYGVSSPHRRGPRHGPRVPAPPAPAAPWEALDRLTSREYEVLTIMARGLKNCEIANELLVSENTVKTHVQNVLTKLGLRNRASAIAAAYEMGLTRLTERAAAPTPQSR